MSNFVNRLKEFLGVKEYDDYEEQIDFHQQRTAEDVIPLRREKTDVQAGKSRSQARPTLVSLAGGQSAQNKMFILEPHAFEDVKEYVLHLKNNKSIILRLHLVDKGEAQRIVDFMSGTTHALDGNMRKLGETIFCFTPASVVIEGDLEADFFEMLKNEGD
ncbi:MAG TPA: cell division protein SepF [Firmicutes bacterium]|nr:cell division protein SepF [Bacillota bacterium]